MKIKKLKARIKCACADHYLELCKSFDGIEYTYLRQCTKCGKVWVDVDKTYDIVEYTVEDVTDIRGNTIRLYRPIIKHVIEHPLSTTEIITNYSVGGYSYVMNEDGTVSMIYDKR